MNTQLLENLEVLKKGLVLLSEDRKVVLHHKSFEHVEHLRAVVNESIELLKMSKYSCFDVSIENGVAYVTMNRPDKLNTMVKVFGKNFLK